MDTDKLACAYTLLFISTTMQANIIFRQISTSFQNMNSGL
jgi:hypothetical protein